MKPRREMAEVEMWKNQIVEKTPREEQNAFKYKW